MASRILKVADYPSLLDKIKICSTDITKTVVKYSLFFYEARNKTAEWYISFPIFLVPFYKYLIEVNLIPAQEVFFDYYISENTHFFKTNRFSQDVLDGLKARIFRTYPSLVRDIHFAIYLKEQLQETIVYNIKLDVEEGIDILVVNKGIIWGVNLFAHTKKGIDSRAIKNHRHEKFSNVNYVDLPSDFKGSQKCCSFFLYGVPELQRLKQLIRQT